MSLHVNQLTGFGAGGDSGIQFVGSASATKTAAVSGNSTLAISSGLSGGISSGAQNGDFVIAAFAVGSNTDRTLSITDGTNSYTLIGSELYRSNASGGEDVNLRVGYKFITSDTNVTFGPTQSTSDPGVVAVYVFRGVNAGTPIDATTTTATADGYDANPPSITPVTAGAFIVAVGATNFQDVATVFNNPSDLTSFVTVSSAGTGGTKSVTIGVGQKNNWVSGSFNPNAMILPSGSDARYATYAAMSIALRPA